MRMFVLLAALALAGCDGASPIIVVSDGWARATTGKSAAGPQSTTGAVYLTIANTGAGYDRLIDVSVTGAAKAGLHHTSVEGGVVRMRALLDGLDIPARRTTALAPGGTHVMLSGLSTPLTAGERRMARLRFARSGEFVIPVTVEAAGAR